MRDHVLDISRTEDGEKLTISLAGEINSMTSKALDAETENLNCSELIFDFKELEYTTSAGIRILLSAKSKMTAKNGTMRVINVNESIAEIFRMVGLYDQFVSEP